MKEEKSGGGRTANELRRYREMLGKTAMQIALEIGMSANYYRKIELGERIPGSQYVGSLERVFRVPFSALYPVFFVKKIDPRSAE